MLGLAKLLLGLADALLVAIFWGVHRGFDLLPALMISCVRIM